MSYLRAKTHLWLARRALNTARVLLRIAKISESMFLVQFIFYGMSAWVVNIAERLVDAVEKHDEIALLFCVLLGAFALRVDAVGAASCEAALIIAGGMAGRRRA